MVNPDVDDCTTKTLNHRKILSKTQKKLLKANRLLKPKYKPSEGPSFAFTVACWGDNSPLAAASRPKHSNNFH